jgi:GT2 family glycosyltransferase
MASIDISIVIVSHNHARFLQDCLSSLLARWHAPSLEVFVVDNCSQDGSADLVRKDFPWVNLIENQQRKGFAANNNSAIRQSSGRYVLVLNPDTETPPGALESLLAFADGKPKMGIGSLQLQFPNRQIQPSCRRFPTFASVLARRTPLRKYLWNSSLNARHLMSDFDHHQTAPVDWMLGACLLARREFLVDVGLMDEGYFLYVEDIDWCYRAWQSEWEVWYYAGAYIIHYHNAESDRRLLSQASWIHWNSIWRYYRKHLAPPWLQLKVNEERLFRNVSS